MGGLTAALALAKKGFKNIDIYEQASSLGFVGAGIQLAPNMARVLDGLGVWDGIAKAATNIQDTSIRRKDHKSSDSSSRLTVQQRAPRTRSYRTSSSNTSTRPTATRTW